MIKIKAITYKEFESLSLENKYKYVEKRWDIKDLQVIGKIRHFKNNNFLFIYNLFNPTTGMKIDKKLFYDQLNDIDVYCSIPNSIDTKELEINNNYVLITLKINDEYSLEYDKVFNCNYLNMKYIERNNLVDEINKLGGYKLIGLLNPSVTSKTYMDLKDAYEFNIKNKMERELKVIDEKILDFEKEKENHLRRLDEKEKQLEIQINDMKRKSKKINNELLVLKELGIDLGKLIEKEESIYKDSSDDELNIVDLGDIDNLIKFTRDELMKRGYSYSEDIIRQYLISLNTEGMVILSGPSGTGKTSLVNEISKILNFKCEIIPVQPNWTDRDDLLGFYNPISKTYVPTRFLDFIIEAADNPDQVYVLCLDELNLAKIEYYLADILSIRELKDGKISLYSDYEYNNLIEEFKVFIEYIKKYEEDFHKNYDLYMRKNQLSLSYKNVKKYTPKIPLPSNLKIVGTMNIEGNVSSLSPKVVDRSFVIPLDKIEKINYTESKFKNLELKKVKINSSYFMQTKLNKDLDLNKDIEEIIDLFNELGIEANYRFYKHYNLYRTIGKKYNYDDIKLIDDIILSKLLPSIYSYDEHIEKFDSIKTYLKENELKRSYEKLSSMIEKSEELGIFTFWS